MINKVILVGRLGKDPEVRSLDSGDKVANFSLATNEYYKDQSGERKERTEWHNIVCWRGLADVAERFLTKGKLIYAEGKIQTRSWDDKDGNTRYTTEVVVDNLQMLDRGNDGGNGTVEKTAANSNFAEGDDDLPF